MKKQTLFSRHIDNKYVENLTAHNLWKEKLEVDCQKGNVFLAIRPGYISFYHKGGGIFTYDKNGFKTNVAYTLTIDKTKFNGDIYENSLKNIVPISSFLEGYDSIKENCKLYSKKSEDEGISRIYHKFPYNLRNSNVVVLDIQIAFVDNQDTKSKLNKVDILLFNKVLQELRFIEAKLFSNSEIHAVIQPQVIGQLERYRNMIDEKYSEIIAAYQEYIKTVNMIFPDLALPSPIKKIDKKVGLLIFGFDKDEREGRLKNQVVKHMGNNQIPYYSLGEIKGIDANELWKQTDK